MKYPGKKLQYRYHISTDWIDSKQVYTGPDSLRALNLGSNENGFVYRAVDVVAEPPPEPYWLQYRVHDETVWKTVLQDTEENCQGLMRRLAKQDYYTNRAHRVVKATVVP